MPVQNPELTIEKSADKTSAKLNDVITFTVKVTNSGDVALTNVTVVDPMMEGGQTVIASLAVGATETITYTHTVTEADVAAGKVENTATATSTEIPDGPSATATVSIVPSVTYTIHVVDEYGNHLAMLRANNVQNPDLSILDTDMGTADEMVSYSVQRTGEKLTAGNSYGIDRTPSTGSTPSDMEQYCKTDTIPAGEYDLRNTYVWGPIEITMSSIMNGMVQTWTNNYAFDHFADAGEFDGIDPIDPIAGNTGNKTNLDIYAVYSPDQIGPDGPDDIPDKYQVVARFISSDPNTVEVTGNTLQVYTLQDASGNYVTSGTVAPMLNGISLEPETANVKEWTVAQYDSMFGETRHPSISGNGPIGPYTANGGDTLVFTAWFEGDLTVTKTRTSSDDVVTVGDTITWDIVITNSSVTAQTVSLRDTLRVSGTQMGWYNVVLRDENGTLISGRDMGMEMLSMENGRTLIQGNALRPISSPTITVPANDSVTIKASLTIEPEAFASGNTTVVNCVAVQGEDIPPVYAESQETIVRMPPMLRYELSNYELGIWGTWDRLYYDPADKNGQVTVAAESPTAWNANFIGWSTDQGATEPDWAYAPGAVLTLTEDLTLYAVWELKEVTLTYDANGGENPPAAQTAKAGEAVTVSDGVPTRDGYRFLGWNTYKTSVANPNYAAGRTVTLTEDMTLYAVWEELFTVMYTDGIPEDMRGNFADQMYPNLAYGTETPEFKLADNHTVPFRTHEYIFEGWAPGVMPQVEYSITYTATWKQIALFVEDVTVAYDGNEHPVDPSLWTVKSGSDEKESNYTERTKFTVVYKDVSGNPLDGAPVEVGTYTAEVTAKIQDSVQTKTATVTITEAKQITVMWIDGYTNGTITQQDINEGAAIPENPDSLIPNHEDEGYRFTDWSQPVPDDAGNITITANYEPMYTINYYVDDNLIGSITKSGEPGGQMEYEAPELAMNGNSKRCTLVSVESSNNGMIVGGKENSVAIHYKTGNPGIRVTKTHDHPGLSVQAGDVVKYFVTIELSDVEWFNQNYFGQNEGMICKDVANKDLELDTSTISVSDATDGISSTREEYYPNISTLDMYFTIPDSGSGFVALEYSMKVLVNMAAEEAEKKLKNTAQASAYPKKAEIDLQDLLNSGDPSSLRRSARRMPAASVSGEMVSDSASVTITVVPAVQMPMDEVQTNTVAPIPATPAAGTATVTWRNDDGAVLHQETGVAVNDVNQYTAEKYTEYMGSNPVKDGGEHVRYEFIGWDDTEDTSGNVTYTAAYNEIVRIEVKWLNGYSGEPIEARMIDAGITPNPVDMEYPTPPTHPGNLTFAGWGEPVKDETTGDITITAQWRDGDAHESDNDLTDSGDVVIIYERSVPVASDTVSANSMPETVSHSIVQYAAPDPDNPPEGYVVKEITVTKVFHGITEEQVPDDFYLDYTFTAGEETYDGELHDGDPGTRNVDPTRSWKLTVFVPEQPDQPDDPTPGTHTVTWVDYDGTVLRRDVVNNGDADPTADSYGTPTRPSDGVYDYTFLLWSATRDEATGNVTYQAHYRGDRRGDYVPTYPSNPSTPSTPETSEPPVTIIDPEVPLAGSVGLNDVDHFAYIIGYSDDTVRPLNNITRAEFAAIAARFLDKGQYTDDGTGDFSDTADHWAAKEIRLAAKAGWIQGSGNKFRPNDYITRAEVMTIVNRMLDRVPDADHMLDTMKKWTDNPEGAWYYEAVQEATNEHAYERDELGVVETWTEILTVRDWKALEEEWANANAR